MAADYRLGPVGNLILLPAPQGGIVATPTKVGGAHELLSGGRTFDTVGVRRDYTLSWEYLDRAEYSILEALYLGAHGPGPFVLIDPTRVNLLSTNQSTGTDALQDTTGLVSASGGTVTSSTLLARTGLRSVLWAHAGASSFAAAATTTTGVHGLTGTPATDTPVLPSTAYTGTLYARAAAGASSLVLYPYLRWYTAAGVWISDSLGNFPTVTNAAWSTLTVTATSPATAAIVRLSVGNNAAIPGGHAGFHLDDWQLEQAAAATAWVPGTGVARVHFAALSDVTPLRGWRNTEAVLLETRAA